jgi:hypothetical protein
MSIDQLPSDELSFLMVVCNLEPQDDPDRWLNNVLIQDELSPAKVSQASCSSPNVDFGPFVGDISIDALFDDVTMSFEDEPMLQFEAPTELSASSVQLSSGELSPSLDLQANPSSCLLIYAVHSRIPGLPDGIYSYPKIKLGSFLEGLAMEEVSIFYGYLVYFKTIRYFYGHHEYFVVIW